MPEHSKIIGRYAPSPTGELHLGNLRTAVLAWLHIRLQGGQFLLRIEDIDLPRNVVGSADQILCDLEWLGLDWDGEIVFQSHRQELYEQALRDLKELALVYPCFCSRRDIRSAASAPQSTELSQSSTNNQAENIYPGTCRNLSSLQIDQQAKQKTPALRLRVNNALANQCGDFIVKRSDQLFAYQLAVVVDDLDQGVNQVVRGSDLADSTARQQYLAKLLAPNRPLINYYHAPLLMDDEGKRMSKRDGSMSISAWRTGPKTRPEDLVAQLLRSLGLSSEQSLSLKEALEQISILELERNFA